MESSFHHEATTDAESDRSHSLECIHEDPLGEAAVEAENGRQCLPDQQQKNYILRWSSLEEIDRTETNSSEEEDSVEDEESCYNCYNCNVEDIESEAQVSFSSMYDRYWCTANTSAAGFSDGDFVSSNDEEQAAKARVMQATALVSDDQVQEQEALLACVSEREERK